MIRPDTLIAQNDSIHNRIINRLDQTDSLSSEIISNQEFIMDLVQSLKMSIETSDNSQLWVGALLGAILSLFLSLAISGILYWKKSKKFNEAYSNYAGIYVAKKKYSNEENKFFELAQDKNKFRIKNGISVIGNEDYEGLITMDENNSNHGTGYYRHNRDHEGTIKFGFLEIQLADSEILVHETIFNKDGFQNSDAYRWERLDANRKQDLFKEYREINLSEKKRKFGV